MFQLVLLFARTFLLSHITTFFFRCVTWTLPLVWRATRWCSAFTLCASTQTQAGGTEESWIVGIKRYDSHSFANQPSLSCSSASLSSESSSLWSWTEKKECLTVIKIDWYLWDFMLCCVVVLLSPLCSMISRYEIVRILLYHRSEKVACAFLSFHCVFCFLFSTPPSTSALWQLRHLKIVAVGNNFNYTQSHLIEFWQCTELYWDWCLGMGGWGAMRVRY